MEQQVKALFTWEGTAEGTATAFADRYTLASIHTTVYGIAKQEDLVTLGNEHCVTHVLHFLDEERLLLVSLADEMGGFTVEVSTADLMID